MRGSYWASRPDHLVCPLCEAGGLTPYGNHSTRCGSCGGRLDGAMLETLRRICALPDAQGKHACECGHPEMRLLPDGTFHCPACRAEVLLSIVPSTDSGSRKPAYRETGSDATRGLTSAGGAAENERGADRAIGLDREAKL